MAIRVYVSIHCMVKGESRQLLYTPEINERWSDSHDDKMNDNAD